MYEYNPYSYANPYANRQVSNPTQSNGFVSVSCEAEARNYPVGYGNSVSFKDENQPYVYTKTAISQMERPIFKKYRLVEEVTETPVSTPKDDKAMDLSNFATKTEIQALYEELQALKKALGEDNT